MSQTRNNHYVPQWYQNGFVEERGSGLRHLKRRKIKLKDGSFKVVEGKKWYTSAQCFYEKDLYSTFFGAIVNDDQEMVVSLCCSAWGPMMKWLCLQLKLQALSS